MTILKDMTIGVLKSIPPSATLEEIIYKINLVAQVVEGIKDADLGKTISTEDVFNKIDSWVK